MEAYCWSFNSLQQMCLSWAEGRARGGEGRTGQELCSAHLLGSSAQGWSLQSADGERSILVEVTHINSHILFIKTWSYGHAYMVMLNCKGGWEISSLVMCSGGRGYRFCGTNNSVYHLHLVDQRFIRKPWIDPIPPLFFKERDRERRGKRMRQLQRKQLDNTEYQNIGVGGKYKIYSNFFPSVTSNRWILCFCMKTFGNWEFLS